MITITARAPITFRTIQISRPDAKTAPQDQVQLSRGAQTGPGVMRGAAAGALLLGAPAALGAAFGPYGMAAGAVGTAVLSALATTQGASNSGVVWVGAGLGAAAAVAGAAAGLPGVAVAGALGAILGACSACQPQQ